MGISRDALPGQRTESGPRRTCGFWDGEEGKGCKMVQKVKNRKEEEEKGERKGGGERKGEGGEVDNRDLKGSSSPIPKSFLPKISPRNFHLGGTKFFILYFHLSK